MAGLDPAISLRNALLCHPKRDHRVSPHLISGLPEISTFNAQVGYRGPRIIAVAGNRGHLWGEQHRIETRTKGNLSGVIAGRRTLGGIYWRPLIADLGGGPVM